MWGSGGGAYMGMDGMADDGGANEAFMMEEKDGTGDGEWGKDIWVIGTPVDGGGAGETDIAPVVTADVWYTGDAADNGGPEGSSE